MFLRAFIPACNNDDMLSNSVEGIGVGNKAIEDLPKDNFGVVEPRAQ